MSHAEKNETHARFSSVNVEVKCFFRDSVPKLGKLYCISFSIIIINQLILLGLL